MYLHVAPRSPRLAPFVSALGWHESALPPGRDRVLPSGTTGLMINLDEDELRTYCGPGAAIVCRAPGAALCGADPRAVVIDTAEQRCGLSVSFTPGGAAPFFGLPLGETAGQLIGLDALWGRDGAVLRERLLEAATPVRQFAVLERVLLALPGQRARHPAAADPVVGLAAAELERGLAGATGERRPGSAPADVHPAIPGPDRPDPQAVRPGPAAAAGRHGRHPGPACRLGAACGKPRVL